MVVEPLAYCPTLGFCSPFLVPEDDRELNALRKAIKTQKLAPNLSPEPSTQDVPVQEWSTYSDVPTFNQLNASLR